MMFQRTSQNKYKVQAKSMANRYNIGENNMNLGAAWLGCHLCVGNTVVDVVSVETGNDILTQCPPPP